MFRERKEIDDVPIYLVTSSVFQDGIGLCYSSIYKGYVLVAGLAKEKGWEFHHKIILVPEDFIGLKDQKLYIKEAEAMELHELGFYNENKEELESASINQHAHCNPALFIETGYMLRPPFKAELCNFGYQIERLKADGLQLKNPATIKEIVDKAGSFCYLNDKGGVSYYVSKESSVYEGYSLARAVNFEATDNIVNLNNTYVLVENKPGGCKKPIDVSALGFIFSEDFIKSEACRNELYSSLDLKQNTIDSLKDLFLTLDAGNTLVLKDKFQAQVEEFLGITFKQN